MPLLPFAIGRLTPSTGLPETAYARRDNRTAQGGRRELAPDAQLKRSTDLNWLRFSTVRLYDPPTMANLLLVALGVPLTAIGGDALIKPP